VSDLFKIIQNKHRKTPVYCKGKNCCDETGYSIKEIPKEDFIYKFGVSHEGRYGSNLRSSRGITLCELCMIDFLQDIANDIKELKESKIYDRVIMRQILR